MTETKAFNCMNGVTGEILACALEEHLREKYQMEVQSGKTTGGYIVKGKQESDFWKKLSGTELSVSIQIIESGEVLNIVISRGSMADKIGAAVLAWFFLFLPLFVTAVIGTKRSNEIVEKIFDYIEQFILSGGQISRIGIGGGSMLSSDEVLCKNCKTANAKGAKFCKNCGANLVVKCPKCGSNISDTDKFCPECGVHIEVETAD